jgi:16S rRNA (guanine966-N2)-methyltransferase
VSQHGLNREQGTGRTGRDGRDGRDGGAGSGAAGGSLGGMTRIISGFAGSLVLKVPRAGTRPTSDRVREAIFSALDARDVLPGARVVDLYAGSGALGLEAASRGASEVTLVERASGAASICRANAALVRRVAPEGAVPEITVAAQAAQAFLEHTQGGFDVVFLDPPYDLGPSELAKALAALSRTLRPGATVMVERASRSPEPVWPDGIALDRRKNYGETTLWWATGAGQPAEPFQSR